MAETENTAPKLEYHIGIYVKDLKKFIDTWERMYGIGPWVNYGRIAFAYLGGVEIEAIEPTGEKLEFIETHGEGMHHWGIFVDDLEGETAKRLERGAKFMFKGRGGNIHLDCDEPGGVHFELLQRRGRISD